MQIEDIIGEQSLGSHRSEKLKNEKQRCHKAKNWQIDC